MKPAEDYLMRLLIISYKYFPLISARAFRWQALAEYWAAGGHTVDVLTGWRPGSARREDAGGVRISRVGGRFSEAIRNKFHTSLSPKGRTDTREGSVGIGKRFRRWLSSALQAVHDDTWKKICWPDYAALWFPPALIESGRMLRERAYTHVISVSDPFTSHLTGYALLRKNSDVRWLVDIGDPFCFHHRKVYDSLSVYESLDCLFEGKVFKRADAVAVTTGAAKSKYGSIFPETENKIEVIPPLMYFGEGKLPARPFFPRDGKIRLVYVGQFYPGVRNPRFLLKLFSELSKTEIGGLLELHIFGDTKSVVDDFSPYSLLLGDKIFLHGAVEPAAGMKAMSEAGMLINVGNETNYQLPSKVVELAGLKLPILNVCERDDDTAKDFFRNHPAVLNVSKEKFESGPEELNTVKRFILEPPTLNLSSIDGWLERFRVKAIASDYEKLLLQ